MNTNDRLQGRIIAGFKLLRILGSGGNGVVYLARQLALDRIAACKILHPELAENPEYIHNFIREARVAARLEHPNIIQALDVGNVDGFYYFAMEYVPGVSLEKIRTGSPERIDQMFLLDISISLADALEYAWSKYRITHGDIKPDNLMICTRGNRLKLADLGLARVAGSDNNTGDIMATPLYAAPEIIMGNRENTGVCSDIYSFGVMLYELLAGNAPFRGSMEEVLRQHVESAAPPLIRVNPAVDTELAALTDQMISKAPADRPASWQAVKDALIRIRTRVSEKSGVMDTADFPDDDINQEETCTQKHIPLILGIFMFLLVILAAYVIFGVLR